MKSVLVYLIVVALMTSSTAVPLAVGICYAGCCAVVTACYTAAGLVYGTVRSADAPITAKGCNDALGTCMNSCTKAFGG